MALDIVISVARKIAESLIDPFWRQFQYLLSYQENIENLEKVIDELDVQRRRVQHLVEEETRNGKNIEEDVVKWLEGVEEVKKVADLVIKDTTNVRMTCLGSWCPNIKSRYFLSQKATKLSNEVQDLIIKKRNFDRVGYLALERQMTHLAPEEVEKFESRSLTVKGVLESLNDYEVSIIGICGMPGVGKTKLVNEIAKRVKVEKSFDEVAIAVVSQSPDFVSIQGQLADQLGLTSLGKDSIRQRADRLSQRLSNDDERTLVILDDLWADLDLASLGIPIKDGRKGLKVMLTSRFQDVCEKMGAQRIIEVELLDETEAWLLFKEISGVSDDDDDLKDIAYKVAEECGGLPLAIVCIGGILKIKKKHAWKDVLRQLRESSVATIEGRQNLVFTRVKLSYESFQDNDYKSLLLLFCLFPEDSDIPIEILVRYVKGLEMFNKVKTLNETRDRVNTIVDDLKACYLLLTSDQLDYDSNNLWQRHVKLHDVVRDVCLSIASEGEHVYMSRHAGLTDWLQNDYFNHFTAISLTLPNMNHFPIGLECPKLRLLRLSCEEVLSNISMEGMKDLRVLNLNSFCVQSALSLQCLMSLRTLCLDYCVFETETSIIGCLSKLEILSFYESTLRGFPKEVAALTNLKLLDLRFKRCHPFPTGIFLRLKQLEELYMGYYDPENEEEAKQAWVTEANSLSHLTTLQIYTNGTKILLQILRGLDLQKMERFDIRKYGKQRPTFPDYENEFQRHLELIDIKLSVLSKGCIKMLLKKTQTLRLEVQGLRNLVTELDGDGFNNLKKLWLEDSDVECIIDATNVVPENGFRNLEIMDLIGQMNLKGLCHGNIQSPWFCKLKKVNVVRCNEITSLFRQSMLRCLVNLQHLKIMRCEKLEEVISMEENTDDKVIELSKLKTLTLESLPRFKRFYLGNTSQALLNQVSLPALEELQIGFVNCPPQIFGSEMQIPKLTTIDLQRCSGVACIAKASSVQLLQNLKELHVFRCKDIQVIFDLEGLKFTAAEGLVLLPRLETLFLRNSLPNLASIWRMPPRGIQTFQNLRSLSVFSCGGLKYLLSPTYLAAMLVSLEKLYLCSCESTEEIMGGEEEEVDDNNKKFLFPKLKRIDLLLLPKLTSFSSREDYELIFPELTELTIHGCPQWKKLSYGKLSTPKLAKVDGGAAEVCYSIIPPALPPIWG